MTDYVIAALAVWRLAVLLVEEEGPWRMFAELRYWVGITETLDGTRVSNGSVTAEAFQCVRCMSVWLAIAATVVLWPDDWRTWLLLPPALSGVAVAIEVMRRR